MRIVFLDESGYVPKWKRGIGAQPYFVLSAVSLPIDSLHATYADMRTRFSGINLGSFARGTLGRGFEIKAADIANGTGYWAKHNTERNSVRDLMLGAPQTYGGIAFMVVVDKQAHINKYVAPTDPYLLSVRYLFERLQHHLKSVDDYAVCIFDQNHAMQSPLARLANNLFHIGSKVQYQSAFYKTLIAKTNAVDRIIELSFGRSENSVGLQIADFFSSMTYQYVKAGKPATCGWWVLLEQSLYRNGRTLRGWGYKEFP